MKRLFTGISSLLAALSLLLAPGIAFAAPFWQVDISTPATQNSRTFGLDYTVLSTELDSFTIQLFQNGIETVQQTQNTSSDPNAFNGNSGTFTITVPSDGTYSYFVTVFRNADPTDRKTTSSKTVAVDSTAPGAPNYAGKTRINNTYTLSFTAPSSPDVTEVHIYTSTNTNYQAGPNTRVGIVEVSANQKTTFTYKAPDSAIRYFALRAFDEAGNGSAIVGDPGIVVTPTRTVILAGGPGTAGAAGANDDQVIAAGAGEVLGINNGVAAANGEVDAAGNNTSGANEGNENNGQVLGSEVKPDDTSVVSSARWYLLAIALAFVAFAYYYFIVRRRVQN